MKAHNFQIDIAPFWTEKGWSLLYRKNHTIHKIGSLIVGFLRRLALLFKLHRYPLVFIHREALPIGPPIIEYIIANVLKKRIIYDFDDAIWLPNTSEQNSIASRLKYHQKVNLICKWSWKVSCGNGFLADFAKKFNAQVFVNPTTIDTTYHKSKIASSSHQPITIGWTGTHSTTKYLTPLVPILKEVKNRYSIHIIIISNQKPDWNFEDYEFVPWNKEKEIEQLDQIDIGIMPLNDSPWEEGKCGFKALQYMAMSKPTIVSNVGVNKILIAHGVNGFLCDHADDWKKSLTDLITSESMRKSIGEQGRKKVVDSYSVESNTELFLSLFE